MERLPNARLTTWPGEGHLALITHVAEVLDDIVARTRLSVAAARLSDCDATSSATTIAVTPTSVDDVAPAERGRRARR